MGLLLNLTTEDSSSQPRAEPTKSPSSERTNLPKKPNKKRKLDSSSTGSTALSSSLFTANPVIPDLAIPDEAAPPESIFDVESFDILDISKNLKGNLSTEFKCITMTKVQKESIPVILNNRDVQVKSATGSGKTLAYAVPVIELLQRVTPPIGRSDGLFTIVILPTRELVLQTYNVFNKLCRAHIRIVPGMLMGGEKKKSEKARLRKGVNILISTPGRLADHLRTTCCLSFERTRMLVLDEADKLVEMGFMKDIKYIITKISEDKVIKHQTVLLSATITHGVEELKQLSLVDPVCLEIGSTIKEKEYKIPDSLKQHLIVLPPKLRLVTLISFIFEKQDKKIIIFLSCKDSVEFHYHILSAVNEKYLPDTKLLVYKLHGDMEQHDRTPVYTKFSTCKTGILFTTDVAARGLDMQCIDWIVQYDCPGSIKDYVHRVGRAARAGTTGRSLLLLNPHETKYIDILHSHSIYMKQVKYEKILEKLTTFISKRNKEECAAELQNSIEKHVQEREVKGLAIRGFQSYVRAYSSVQFKDCFSIKDLHLGHVAKTFGLTEAPSAFLHKNLTRKKQIEKRKEVGYERKVKMHSDDGKKRKKKRKLNLISDEDIKGLAVLSGPKAKKDRT